MFDTNKVANNIKTARTKMNMTQIGELVKTESVESKVNEIVEKGGKIPFSVLVSLAPFMDKEVLGKMAEELADVEIKKLCAIAPFISRETLDKIVDRCIANDNMDGNGIVSIAPFLSKSTIQKVAEYLMAHGQAQKVVAIAPFMGRDMFPKDLSNIDWQENGNGFAYLCNRLYVL